MNRSSRITQRQVDRIEGQLTFRDQEIVATLRRVRVACSRQLERLHFIDASPLTNARSCRRRLEHLTRIGVLARLERRVGGVRAGSAGFVYGLDRVGQRLSNGRGPAGGEHVRRPWSPSHAFVDHMLDVTELFVRLTEAERSGRLELLDFVTEPECWRWFFGPVGVREVLKPDAFVRVGLGAYEDSWFVEVDRATESMPALGRKLDAYRRYWSSGREQANGVFPGVLIVVPGDRRYAQAVDVSGKQPAEAWRLFRVTRFADAVDVIAGDKS